MPLTSAHALAFRRTGLHRYRRCCALCMVYAGCCQALYARSAHAAPSEPAQAPEVVVHGERASLLSRPRERHLAGSVITRERLAQPGATAAELLRQEAGAQSTELGGFGAWSSVSLRGASAAQTPVYLGSLRLNDELSGAANLSDIPLFFVERAEIYRSHAPAFVDQLGVGGALVLEPRRILRNELSAGATLGSYGFRSLRGYAAFRSGERRLLAGVDFTATDNDYSFPNGNGTLFQSGDDRVTRLANADVTQRNLWLTGSDQLMGAQVRFTYHRAEREQGALKLAALQSQEARASRGQDALLLETSVPLPGFRGKLGLSSSALLSEINLIDPLAELSLAASSTVTSSQRLEQGAFLQHGVGEHLQLIERVTFGLERLERFDEREAGHSELLSATRARVRASASQTARLTDQLSLNALLSLGTYSTSGEAQKNAAQLNSAQRSLAAGSSLQYEPEGRIGLAYRTGASELFGNLGHYRRTPTLAELYGVSLLVRGNPALKSERGTSFELGARHQFLDARCERRVWVEASAFARLSEQLIVYETSAQGYLLPRNRRHSRSLGSEFLVGARPVRFLHAELTLSLLDARDTSAERGVRNDILPFLSRASASSWLALEHDFQQPLIRSVSLGLRGSYRSSRYANPAGAGVIPEQTVFDVEASARLLYEAIVTRLRVADVFDVERFDMIGFPLPRRSIYLSVESVL